MRTTKERGKIQKFLCRKCGKRFCYDDGFKRKQKSTETIIRSVGLYVGGGSSLRTLAEYLDLSKNTILAWIFQYSNLLYKFTSKFVPTIIQKINLDELFLKMCNQFFYLWDAICAESRFAFFYFSPTRRNKDAKELIKQFRNAMLMIFDGAFQYPAVLKEMFGVWWYYHHTHRCKDFKDKKHNNLVERLQNFVRSKTRQRRGFKSLQTGIIQLRMLFIYYNFVRRHSAIKMTPAEKEGLIDYYDATNEKKRWRFLIKEATKQSVIVLCIFISRGLGQSL